MSNTTREVVRAVVSQLSKGEEFTVEQAIIAEQFDGDLQAFAVAAVAAYTAGQKKAARKIMRDADASNGGKQLQLDGMEHCSLPSFVWTKTDDGEDMVKPWTLSTLQEIKREIAQQRRTNTVRSRVISGWEETAEHMEAQGATSEMTGEEITARFGNAIEQ